MPRARAAFAIGRSKVKSSAPTRCAIAMCNASSVRSVKFSRRRNPARSGEVALVINNGVVVRAIRASNVENAACASSRGYELHPNPACCRRREFGRREVADHQQGRTRPQNCIGASSQRVDGEQGYRDARVEIDTQRSSSSRILLTKVPASSSGNFLPTQRAASQSRSAGVTGLACRGMASSSTTGRAMTRDDDSSPSSARSINSGSRFLASATLWVVTEEL